MSTINKKTYSTTDRLNLAKGALRFGATNSSSPFDSSSYGLHLNSSGQLVFSAAGTTEVLAGPGATAFSSATTTGAVLTVTNATAYTGTGLLTVTGNSATTGTLVSISGTGLTTGVALQITGSGASLSTGATLLNISMGAATGGNGLAITTTGVYTNASTALIDVIANNATTAPQLCYFSATGLTTGSIYVAVAAAATLTTGFYYRANDGAINVFTVGANGHITSNQTTAPTIAVTTQNGITAAAVTAGSSDTSGKLTTTGTNDNVGNTVLTVTFNKTYTNAPKSVMLTPANASGAGPNPPYISSITATTFVITIPAHASAGATPSWYYQVIA